MYVSAHVPGPGSRPSRRSDRENRDGSPLFYPNPQFESSDLVPDSESTPTVYNFKLRFGCGSVVNLDDTMDDDEDYFEPMSGSEPEGHRLLKSDVPTEVSILLRISNFFSSIMRMTKCK